MQQITELLLANGFNLKQQGEEYIANCIHCSAERSMSVYLHEEKWISHCHECGKRNNTEEVSLFFADKEKPLVEGTITEETAIEEAARWIPSIADEIVPDMKLKNFGVPSKYFTYRNQDGQIIGYAAQYETKLIYWVYGSFSKNVSPKWVEKHFFIFPLYNSDKIAKTKGYVGLVEGEQAADDSCKLLPFPCTTWTGEQVNVRYTDFSLLKGRKVVIILNSAYGESRHITWLVKHLIEVVKAEVSTIDTTGFPVGWNLSSALSEGWDMDKTTSWLEQNELCATVRDTAMEKLAPKLSIVPPPETYSVEVHSEVQEGNTIKRKVTQLEYIPSMPEEFSDAALEKAWTESMGKEWKYTTKWNKWHKFDGTCWREDSLNKIVSYCKRKMIEIIHCEAARNLTHAQKSNINSLRMFKNVITLSQPERAVHADSWDSDPFQIGTPDGIVNLKDGTIRPATVEDNITKLTTISPDMNATVDDCPLWIASLRRATDGSDEMLDYLQRWCYYILTGDTRHECFLFVIGSGGTGKSTFLRVLYEIMGEYSRAAQMDTFAAKNQEHSTEIAGLAGSRLVTATETEEGTSWNESRIKALTGRDKISARFMRCDFFEFSPQFKIVLAGNHKPQLKSVGEEMRRRIHLLDFPNIIPEADRIQSLPEKLQGEYPAILKWMIDGRTSWNKLGMKKPDSVTNAVEAYLESEDTIGDWVNECCDIHPNGRIRSSDAYTSYVNYANTNGEFVISQKRFSQRLENKHYDSVRSSGGRIFIGLMLK